MITLDDFKNATGIKNKDEQIEALLPIVEEHIKGYCNIKEVPLEYHMNAIKMVEYQLNTKAGLTSESLSRHSVSFANNYPEECTKGLRRRLRW